MIDPTRPNRVTDPAPTPATRTYTEIPDTPEELPLIDVEELEIKEKDA